jgi:putative Mn2+ efflux pump MntP
MSLLELLAVAVALAMDAFAVAVAAGLVQAAMPGIGWFGGHLVRDYFLRFGHWIAFALLLYIGGHMLWEGLRHDEDETCQDPTVGSRLIMLAVATSIDALAVGFSLAMLAIPIWTAAAVIGAVAFAFTAAGLHLGMLLGCRTRLGQHAEILGGLVLLGIGAKILWQALG